MDNHESPDESKQVNVRGEILTAKYHPMEKAIMIAIRLPDGNTKSSVVYAASLMFHGRPYQAVPAEEIDREMEKTAELFRRAKGRSIKLTVYENQI